MYDLNDIKPTALTLVLPVNHDAYGIRLVAAVQRAAGCCLEKNLGIQPNAKHGIIFEYIGEGQACDAFVRIEQVLVDALGEDRLNLWDIDLHPYRGKLATDVVP